MMKRRSVHVRNPIQALANNFPPIGDALNGSVHNILHMTHASSSNS